MTQGQALTTADTIPANTPVTVYFSAIIGPSLASPDGSALDAAIGAAFGGTTFDFENLDVPVSPVAASISGAAMWGQFYDQGGGYSLITGSNISYNDFVNFIESILNNVPGLYEVSVSSVNWGANLASGLSLEDVARGGVAVSDTLSSFGQTLANLPSQLPSLTTVEWVALGILLLVVVVAVATHDVI